MTDYTPDVAQGWRDIATAPRDGSRILLFQRGRGAFEGWWKTEFPRAGEYWMDDQDSEPEPTHWQPRLPDPGAAQPPAAPVETDSLRDSRNPNHGRIGGLRDADLPTAQDVRGILGPALSRSSAATEGEKAARDYENGYNDGIEWAMTKGDLAEENRKLRERLGPQGLEVVFIGDVGHYVNEKVKAEIDRLRAVPQPTRKTGDFDFDNLTDLVSRFSAALLEKLKAAEAKYGHNSGWMRDDWMADCQRQLSTHLAKGDPRDVAAYCAFMWHHGWPTTANYGGLAMLDLLIQAGYDASLPHPECFKDFSYLKLAEILKIQAASSPLSRPLLLRDEGDKA